MLLDNLLWNNCHTMISNVQEKEATKLSSPRRYKASEFCISAALFRSDIAFSRVSCFSVWLMSGSSCEEYCRKETDFKIFNNRNRRRTNKDDEVDSEEEFVRDKVERICNASSTRKWATIKHISKGALQSSSWEYPSNGRESRISDETGSIWVPWTIGINPPCACGSSGIPWTSLRGISSPKGTCSCCPCTAVYTNTTEINIVEETEAYGREEAKRDSSTALYSLKLYSAACITDYASFRIFIQWRLSLDKLTSCPFERSTWSNFQSASESCARRSAPQINLSSAQVSYHCTSPVIQLLRKINKLSAVRFDDLTYACPTIAICSSFSCNSTDLAVFDITWRSTTQLWWLTWPDRK